MWLLTFKAAHQYLPQSYNLHTQYKIKRDPNRPKINTSRPQKHVCNKNLFQMQRARQKPQCDYMKKMHSEIEQTERFFQKIKNTSKS